MFITALQIAAYKGNAAIVRLLFERGADPNIQGGRVGSALAAAQSHKNVKRLLLE